MLKISLRPSWVLVSILALAHGAAIAIILLVGIPWWAQVIAVAGLTVHLVVVVRQQALLLGRDSTVAIEIHSDNTLSVQARRGAWSEYAVVGDTYVAPYLTVMNLRQTDSHALKRIVILPDSLDAEEFRKLRVWLCWREETRPA